MIVVLGIVAGTVALAAAGVDASAAEIALRLATPAGSVAATHGDNARAVLAGDHRMYLEAQPLKGEGLLAMSRRLCGSERGAEDLRREGGGGRSLQAGRWYRLPYDRLSPELQERVLATLFSGDRPEPEGWRHQVRQYRSLPQESLWRIAERFTGTGQNYRAIRAANGLEDNDVHPGQRLLIPRHLLLAPFGARLPAPPLPASTQGPGGSPTVASAGTLVGPASAYRLEYGRDEQGEYALYRLKPGEALYSSVVVRFTGRIYASDVNALAEEIARRNGVPDVTDMPIGFPVKIDLEHLLPEYLPAGDPRRRSYEQSLRASAAFSNKVRSRDLSGITVILDAGHGGRDIGTSQRGVWESLYVYDIMVRLKTLLESTTAAEVFTTTRDGSAYRISERDVLPFSRNHVVLTHPPFPLNQQVAGKPEVHLRWYLANSIFRHQVASGHDPEKIVFISIHADSLHPSIRGAMAYIPDANLRQGSFGKSGAVFASRKEWKEGRRVSFSWKERIKSEGLSRQLAEEMIAAFRRRKLAVHPDKPVRQKIYRGRRPWVPAVLRYNAVPAELLFEVSNLANSEDRRLIQTRAFRQQAAEAIAEGILAYYQESPGGGVAVAASGR